MWALFTRLAGHTQSAGGVLLGVCTKFLKQNEYNEWVALFASCNLHNFSWRKQSPGKSRQIKIAYWNMTQRTAEERKMAITCEWELHAHHIRKKKENKGLHTICKQENQAANGCHNKNLKCAGDYEHECCTMKGDISHGGLLNGKNLMHRISTISSHRTSHEVFRDSEIPLSHYSARYLATQACDNRFMCLHLHTCLHRLIFRTTWNRKLCQPINQWGS